MAVNEPLLPGWEKVVVRVIPLTSILSPCGLTGVCIVAEDPKYHVIPKEPFGVAQDKLRD